MNKNLRFSLLMLLLAVVSGAWAEDKWVMQSLSQQPTDGQEVVIVDLTSGTAMSNSNGTSSAPSPVAVSLNADGTELAEAPDDNIIWTVTVDDDGYLSFAAGSSYLYCTNTNNGVRVGSNDNNKFDTEGYENAAGKAVVFLKNVATSRYIGVYKESGTPKDWRCYTSINSNIRDCDIVLFVKTEDVSGKTKIATDVSFSPTEVNVDDTGSFTLTATYATGASYSITWASDDEDIIEVDNDGAYTAYNPGSANVTVTITPDDEDTYEAVSKKVKVTVKAGALENIAALTEQTTAGSYDVALNNAVVTYTNGNYAYIQDESGAVVMYKSGHGLSAGQMLNGTATVTYQLRYGNPQITALSGVTPEAGTTTPAPTEVTPDNFPVISDVLSQWFKVTGASITKNGTRYYVDLNGQNVQLYAQGDAQGFSISNFDATYTIVGFPTIYVNNGNTTLELQIFEAPEMEAGELPFVGTINGLEPLELTVGDEGEFIVDFTPYEGLTEGSDYHIYCNSDDLDIIWTASIAKVYRADAPGTVTVTVTVEPTDDEAYTTVTKDFTVTVKGAPYENIAALTEQTTAGTYDVVLNNAVVTYTNGNYAYIQDESGAVLYYKSGHGLSAGQVLNGTATVAYQLRNNNPQITSLTGVDPEAGTSIPEPTEVTPDEFPTFLTVLSQWFKVTGATITYQNDKYYVSLGGNDIQLYGQGDARNFGLESLEGTFTVIGFPTLYNDVWELQIFEVPQPEGELNDIMTDVVLEPTEMTVGDTGVFTVTGELADGAEMPTVTYGSSDETILSVTEIGEFEALAEGTVTVTVALTPQDEDAAMFNSVVAEFEVTVNSVPEPQGITYYQKITSTDDLTTGKYLIVYEPESVAFDGRRDASENTSPTSLDGAFNNTPVTISADNIIATDQPIYFTINTTNGSVTSASGHTIGVTTYGNGLKMDRANFPSHSFDFDEDGNVIMSIEIYDGETLKGTMILNYNTNKNDHRFRYYKEGSQKAIQLYKEMSSNEVPSSVAIAVGQHGAVSFSSPYALDFTDADVQAYIVTEKNGNYFNKVQVTQVAPNTGVVVEGAEGQYSVPLAELMPEALEDNLLVATSTGAYTVEEADYGRAYGLFYSTTKQAVGFKKMAVGKETAVNKCYLLLPEADGANEIFFGITDGINTVETVAPAFEGDAYNLNGQKVNASYKGVIIVNGKKVINR